jgi:hypothetical protein
MFDADVCNVNLKAAPAAVWRCHAFQNRKVYAMQFRFETIGRIPGDAHARLQRNDAGIAFANRRLFNWSAEAKNISPACSVVEHAVPYSICLTGSKAHLLLSSRKSGASQKTQKQIISSDSIAGTTQISPRASGRSHTLARAYNKDANCSLYTSRNYRSPISAQRGSGPRSITVFSQRHIRS